MKVSIKNIFNNIILFMLFILFASFISVLLTFEQGNSYKKVDILNNQKSIISTLHKIDKKDLELALIQFNGKSTQLHYQIERLKNLYQYDITGNYILNNSESYLTQLNKLNELVNTYNTHAYQYYKSTKETEEALYKSFDNSFKNLNELISSIIFQNIIYDNEKFKFLQILAIFAFVFISSFTFWYYKRLNKVYDDIAFLFNL